jgi:NAD(P)-dependent dehydrogenase (short-subunit alcohol dehydrogenase family)
VGVPGLEGHTALVTGAGSGIGAASAAALARAGASVAVTDIDAESAETVAKQITAAGGTASAYRLDVGDEAAWATCVAAVTEMYGTVTVLHSNAAPTSREFMSRDLDIASMDLGLWRRVIDVALTGGMLACKHTLPGMLDAGGGAIVMTSSVKGVTGSAYRSAYNSAKGGLDALVRTVATGYGKKGVRCNAIAPGIVETPGLRETVPPARMRELEDAHMLPYLGTSDDIAEAVLFLASDASRFVTGQVMIVDGGLTAHAPALSPDGSR